MKWEVSKAGICDKICHFIFIGGVKATDGREICAVYGERSIPPGRCCFLCIKNRKSALNDGPHTGLPIRSMNLFPENTRQMTRQLAEQMDCDKIHYCRIFINNKKNSQGPFDILRKVKNFLSLRRTKCR